MAPGKKPDDNDWIDLARGLRAETAKEKGQLDPATRSRMERFRRFHEFARAEGANRPPESLLRKARALACRLPAGKPGRIKTIVAALRFDSATQPAMAGVRNVEMDVRQMVYEAEGFDIYLRAEPAGAQGAVVLVGQVLAPGGSETPLSQLPVRVLSGKSEVAATVTNELGEFQLESPKSPSMALEVLVEARGLSLRVAFAELMKIPT